MTTPVSIHMVNAIKAQTELFSLVTEFAPRYAQEILGQQAIPHNNFWRTVRYRAVLLTFDVNEPENNRKYPYCWLIYHEKPTILIFSEKPSDSDKWEQRLPLYLEQDFYFQLLDDDKRKLISAFVRKSIESIKQNRA